MGKRLSAGGKVAPRQLQYQQASPAWVADHKSWKPGGHYTASRQLSRSESDLSRWFPWCLFQAVPLVSASAGQPACLGEVVCGLYCLHALGEEGTQSIWVLRNFLEGRKLLHSSCVWTCSYPSNSMDC